jgi:hypothetical protein
MYKPSNYSVVTYFPICFSIYETYFLQNWLPRKQNISSLEVHPQLNNNGHPMDGALVGAGFTVAKVNQR